MDGKTVVLQYVCPALGTVAANQMFLAPLRDVQRAIARGSLGDLNPLPWVFMLGNCTGWTLYSILNANYFVFAANAPGLLLAVWFNLAASKLSFKQQFAKLPAPDGVDEVGFTKLRAGAAVDLEQGGGGGVGGGGGEGSYGKGGGIRRRNKNRRYPATATPPDEDTPLAQAKRIGSSSTSSSSSTDRTDSQHTATGDSTATVRFEEEEQQQPQPAHTGGLVEIAVFYTAPRHDYYVMGTVVLWLAVMSAIGFARGMTPGARVLIVGLVTNLNLVFFYGAPLSTIATVLRTKNTATIHVPTMLTNTISSVFWAVYGLAVMDLFICVPNGLGSVLGFAQVSLYLVYPREESVVVPVITAAAPDLDGGAAGEDGVVQLQLHEIKVGGAVVSTADGAAPIQPPPAAGAIPEGGEGSGDGIFNDNNTSNNRDGTTDLDHVKQQQQQQGPSQSCALAVNFADGADADVVTVTSVIHRRLPSHGVETPNLADAFATLPEAFGFGALMMGLGGGGGEDDGVADGGGFSGDDAHPLMSPTTSPPSRGRTATGQLHRRIASQGAYLTSTDDLPTEANTRHRRVLSTQGM